MLQSKKVFRNKSFYCKIKLLFTLFYVPILIVNSSHQSFAKEAQQKNTIVLFNWWDYLTPSIQTKLSKNNFEYTIIEYRSNEVALAKLLSPSADYDVIIISNWVLDVLDKTHYLDLSFNETLLKERDYIPFLKNLKNSCIPYMWSTTTFSIESNQPKKDSNTIAKLLTLKKNGFKVGFIDDPIEFTARVILDNKSACHKNGINSKNLLEINQKCEETLQLLKKDLDPRDFRNSLETFLGPNTAIYGWHGVTGATLNTHPNLNFVLPQSDIVLGADYVCIPKKKRYKPNLKKFVEFLTNKENTEIQVNELQYFSPYNHHEVAQHPKITQLKADILERVKTSPPIFLSAPQPESHSRINKWWQSIRYGKQQ